MTSLPEHSPFSRFRSACLRAALVLLPALVVGQASAQEPAESQSDLFARSNLVAWCIVPFDAAHRTPEERAQMLDDLQLRACAYDWRAAQVPEFEEEILAYRRHGIRFFAFWDQHEAAFDLFAKYEMHPQIWKTAPSPAAGTQAEKVAAAAESLKPLAERTRQLGCRFGLYNHGGWGGQPENLVAVCRRLRELGFDHAGIVYNFHHAHEHLDNWAQSFEQMQPYLLCVNINGMTASGMPKILPVGQGDQELEMLQIIQSSGYEGPIGILDHRPELDAREALLQNLRGLEKLRPQLQSTSR